MAGTYCEAWPEELKESERQRYHAECLIRCLEAKLDRIEPFSEEFERTMEALDKAHASVREAAVRSLTLHHKLASNET